VEKERQQGREACHVAASLRFLHPFDVARHPSLEPEVKRAILARWASDRSAVAGQPALRKPPGLPRAVPVDDVLAAPRC